MTAALPLAHMSRRAILQVSLLNIAVALMILPLESVLNRIMIQELGMAATLVAGLVALRYITAPLRIVFGRISDTRPIAGRRRTPYIAAGLVLMAVGLALAPFAAYSTPTLGTLGVLLTTATFVLIGFGVNMVTPLYFAIVADQSNPTQRTRVVATMYVLLALCAIIASLLIGQALEQYTPDKVIGVCATLAVVGLLCGVLGLWGLEKRAGDAQEQATQPRVNEASLRDIGRLLLRNAEVFRFFAYLILTFIAIEAQEVVLEPYGAQIFAMTPSQTARLTGFLRLGLLIMLLLGVVIVNRWGHKVGSLAGMALTGLGLALIIVAGVEGSAGLFQGGVFVMGCGSGLLATTNLSLMLNLTDPGTAGLHIGTWTFAQAVGVGGATFGGGLLRDLGLALFNNSLAGYLTVFSVEIAALVLAVPFILALSVQRFHERNQGVSPAVALAAALE